VCRRRTCNRGIRGADDVATARDFARENDKLVAAYSANGGQLWRYTPAGASSLAYNFTCNQPCTFHPRWCKTANSVASSHPHEIYLVQ